MSSRPGLVLMVVSVLCTAQTPSLPHADFRYRLVAAAIERTHHTVRYVSTYVRIPYPGGDVPSDTGVCTDEIIRAYRTVGVDLQKEVHEDMLRNFGLYPNKRRWLLAHPDSNIDHRRVPNLMVFFQRKGESLPVSGRAEDFAPGDLVTWDLGGGVPHIGIVVDQKAVRRGRSPAPLLKAWISARPSCTPPTSRVECSVSSTHASANASPETQSARYAARNAQFAG